MTQGVMSIVGREIQLTKDYTTGNATFKQGSRGTVIEATSRKDGKLKVKLDNDNTKTFRLIKERDLQLYPDMNTSAGMTLFVAHRFNQKQIQKPINELTTPMMLFFNCLTQLLILKIVTIVNYSHLLRCTL